ncbi:hypothetical protein BROUX41_001202 [Berkeleyomyces rouxiae]|uniref:uncharacterized protein n=1 Tax=Berkeleyomyces rouxiae TaxID=2035830 RepID=UPI003B7D6985
MSASMFRATSSVARRRTLLGVSALVAFTAPRMALASASRMARQCTLSAPAALGVRAQVGGGMRYSTAAGGVEDVEVFDFEKMQKLVKEQPEEYVIVDARERGELVQTGTIPSAVNIPIASAPDSFQIHDEDFEDRFGFERPARDKTLLFFCKAGVRSHAAARMARDAGWRTAEYPGSWVDWAAKGGDVTHSFD